MEIGDFILWDNHVCMPTDGGTEFLSEIERYRHAAVDVVTLNIGFGTMSLIDHIRVISAQRQWFSERSDRYALIRTAQDIRDAKRAGKLAILFDIEGMGVLEFEGRGELSLVQLFYDLGVRWMLVAYNQANLAGGGCQDAEDSGLTSFGRDVIREMERVGMIPCVSHTGWKTAADVLTFAKGPVILSHSNPFALVNHPRNVPDDIIQGVAATGGVIGINGVGAFLGGDGVSVANVIRHISYVADLVGPEHVGLSLDYIFDRSELDLYIAQQPQLFPRHLYKTGMKFIEPEQIQDIATGLRLAGYRAEDRRGILGGNWLRLADQVWK